MIHYWKGNTHWDSDETLDLQLLCWDLTYMLLNLHHLKLSNSSILTRQAPFFFFFCLTFTISFIFTTSCEKVGRHSRGEGSAVLLCLHFLSIGSVVSHRIGNVWFLEYHLFLEMPKMSLHFHRDLMKCAVITMVQYNNRWLLTDKYTLYYIRSPFWVGPLRCCWVTRCMTNSSFVFVLFRLHVTFFVHVLATRLCFRLLALSYHRFVNLTRAPVRSSVLQ